MRLTIKTKLAAVFTTVVALSGASMFMALQNLGTINSSMASIVQGPVTRSLQLEGMQGNIFSIANDTRAMILSTDEEVLQQRREQIATAFEAVSQSAQSLVGQFGVPESNAEMEQVVTLFGQYGEVLTRVLEEAAKNTDDASFEMSMTQVSGAYKAVEASVKALQESLANRPSIGEVSNGQAGQVAGELMLMISDTMRQHRNVLLASEDPDQQDIWQADYITGVADLEALTERLGRVVPASETTQFNQVSAEVGTLIEAMSASNNVSLQRSAYNANAVNDTEGQALRDEIDALVNSMIERNNGVLSDAVASANELYEQSRMLLIALLIGSVAIAAVAAIWIVVSISRALSSAVRLANDVAEGDLNATATVKGDDEIGDLIKALNAMTEKLREVVGEVTAATRNVAAGSQEMSATAEQLSQGATEQASSTEEASASMEEMASTIKQSADNASQTETIARQSAADAIASGEAVDNAVNAMQTIAEKIMVVQEIARQTDLLALNAAVEAARAGEHGRGFAVVASEVRKLAERSQAAAAEISTLSGTTVKAAQSAGEMLSKLVPDIQRTAELVEEISAGSREQNAGAAQINTAIQQLDKVTQQNTSAAEEMSSTAEELASQAEQLQAAISYFRLEAAQARAAATGEKAGKTDLKKAIMAAAPHMKSGAKTQERSGGFDLELGDGQDDLDTEFMRRGAA